MNKIKSFLCKLESYNEKVLLLFSLLFVNLFALIAGSLIVYLTTNNFDNFISAMWWVVKAIIDPGFLDEHNGSYLTIISFIIVLVGYITFSSGIIALISTMMFQRIESIKKGNRAVPFTNHIVILNWNDKIYEIINEFLISSEKTEIVVLAEGDKEKHENLIRKNINLQGKSLNSRKNTILFRQGSPFNSMDLSLINVSRAKTIIVLSDCLCKKDIDKDMVTIKTLMALSDQVNEDSNTIAEINLDNNKQYARMVFKNKNKNMKLIMLNGNRVIGRIMSQSSIQPYIEGVYEELFSYEGSEIYTKSLPFDNEVLKGDRIWERHEFIEYFVSSYSGDIPIGYINRDNKPEINPSQWVIDKDTKIITISKDDSSIIPLYNQIIPQELCRLSNNIESKVINILIIGCNSKLNSILTQYKYFIEDLNALDGSHVSLNVTVLSQDSMEDEVTDRKNLNIKHIKLNIGDEDNLDKLLPDSHFNSVLLLSKEGTLMSEKDINILKWVIIIKEKYNNDSNIRVITEVLDPRNSDLIKKYGEFDIIISNRIVSKIITQESRNSYLELIYKELITYKGSEIYIKDAGKYFECNCKLKFRDIIYLTSVCGDIAIGIVRNNKIIVNPDFDDEIIIGDNDKIIVVAENIL